MQLTQLPSWCGALQAIDALDSNGLSQLLQRTFQRFSWPPSAPKIKTQPPTNQDNAYAHMQVPTMKWLPNQREPLQMRELPAQEMKASGESSVVRRITFARCGSRSAQACLLVCRTDTHELTGGEDHLTVRTEQLVITAITAAVSAASTGRAAPAGSFDSNAEPAKRCKKRISRLTCVQKARAALSCQILRSWSDAGLLGHKGANFMFFGHPPCVPMSAVDADGEAGTQYVPSFIEEPAMQALQVHHYSRRPKLVRESAEAQAIAHLIVKQCAAAPPEGRIVGFDVEWKPTFAAGESQPPAVAQVRFV